MTDLSVTFLEDGRQSLDQTLSALVQFIAAAQGSVAIAIYDVGLSDRPSIMLADALNQCQSRGVVVRLAYYAGPHRSGVVPPPTGRLGEFLARLQVAVSPVAGFQALMHHKYVVRDAGTPIAAVWTGSTNWTDDAWQREENVIISLPSAPLAALYLADFEELWSRRLVENTGGRDGGDAGLNYAGAPVPGHVWFSPGQGVDMAQAVGMAIAAAQRRVVLGSPVLTDGPILGALRDLARGGRVPLAGVIDATQMHQVLRQWADEPQVGWKAEAFLEVAAAGRFSGKHSTPFAPNSLHDFMHAKIVVVDDTVFLGSYNFSRSGEENAENLLRLVSPKFADTCVTFLQGVIARYPAWPPAPRRQPPI